MANSKISELTSAGALTGAEEVEVIRPGTNLRTTAQQIANLATGGGGVEHWRGAWAGTTALPVDADGVGSGTAGVLAGGDHFVFTNQVVFGGSVFPAKSIAYALQATPTTLAHWSILAAQS